mmetsp:Transcript_19500/g.52524  ORF Transcript_19500/g.52524 Transcript_19500/m.52524 type:complete len:191 (-) Transcript_19500:396-968(-)|eukprot:CAMPEP_0185184252 /NCGR_PEP_ID=MMETSP1140-20130426/2471_1 /TAXON_ID=298111 /ORGANISM="Pavlova sp., Strain CCMP459" /LENGTH=190 /DNA_ID=CAMNT_0027750311 /DNA_START=40 /DNA_END=612 /DNA_ORIENTATION=+
MQRWTGGVALLLLSLAATSDALARVSALLPRAARVARARPALEATDPAREVEECVAEAENPEEAEACMDGLDFEAEVLKQAKTVPDFSGEGAWVLVTREFDDGEVEDDEADLIVTEEEDSGEGEEGVILVQDPKDDKFILPLFQSEEDATRFLYMLLDEDIDSEATYAAAWYSAEDVTDLLDEEIKIGLI